MYKLLSEDAIDLASWPDILSQRCRNTARGVATKSRKPQQPATANFTESCAISSTASIITARYSIGTAVPMVVSPRGCAGSERRTNA